MPWANLVLAAVALVATVNVLTILLVARAHQSQRTALKRRALTRMPPQLPRPPPESMGIPSAVGSCALLLVCPSFPRTHAY